MLETFIVRYGAPTLAGMKTGSLFTMKTESMEDVQQEVVRVNRMIQSKGVRLTVLKAGKHRAMIYLYREAQLIQCLACPKAQEILHACGYMHFSIPGALDTLRERLQTEDRFPHEIGLFLGYPLADVTGFMRHCGKNCLFHGCWKVYGQEAEAMRTFARYHKCTAIYAKYFHTGTPLAKLIVAAKTA